VACTPSWTSQKCLEHPIRNSLLPYCILWNRWHYNDRKHCDPIQRYPAAQHVLPPRQQTGYKNRTLHACERIKTGSKKIIWRVLSIQFHILLAFVRQHTICKPLKKCFKIRSWCPNTNRCFSIHYAVQTLKADFQKTYFVRIRCFHLQNFYCAVLCHLLHLDLISIFIYFIMVSYTKYTNIRVTM
jgi:hypothetical protein